MLFDAARCDLLLFNVTASKAVKSEDLQQASMVSTPSLPSAAHEVADSVLLTDEEAEQFLLKFPLMHILE